eukprot:TRINITY_DN67474_c4_g1_i1.p1 TRINITY_DN67474_c4_g1~~TRINITY_DN67474_c4_g1_i1.p1  ORF type:complete len:201 (-),score=16.11 TRINITY_DN67474_c4_g1_i1:125-727(-)
MLPLSLVCFFVLCLSYTHSSTVKYSGSSCSSIARTYSGGGSSYGTSDRCLRCVNFPGPKHQWQVARKGSTGCKWKGPNYYGTSKLVSGSCAGNPCETTQWHVSTSRDYRWKVNGLATVYVSDTCNSAMAEGETANSEPQVWEEDPQMDGKPPAQQGSLVLVVGVAVGVVAVVGLAVVAVWYKRRDTSELQYVEYDDEAVH